MPHIFDRLRPSQGVTSLDTSTPQNSHSSRFRQHTQSASRSDAVAALNSQNPQHPDVNQQPGKGSHRHRFSSFTKMRESLSNPLAKLKSAKQPSGRFETPSQLDAQRMNQAAPARPGTPFNENQRPELSPMPSQERRPQPRVEPRPFADNAAPEDYHRAPNLSVRNPALNTHTPLTQGALSSLELSLRDSASEHSSIIPPASDTATHSAFDAGNLYAPTDTDRHNSVDERIQPPSSRFRQPQPESDYDASSEYSDSRNSAESRHPTDNASVDDGASLQHQQSRGYWDSLLDVYTQDQPGETLDGASQRGREPDTPGTQLTPLQELQAKLDDMLNNHDAFDSELHSPALTPATTNRSDQTHSSQSSNSSAGTEYTQNTDSSASSQTSASDDAPTTKTKRTNPFKRAQHWATHHSNGDPINKLRKRGIKAPEPETPMEGQGLQFQLAVKDNGTLEFQSRTSPEMKEILSKTLGAHGRQFTEVKQIGHGDTPYGSRAYLKDTAGFSHYLSSNDTGLIAMHTSLPRSVVQVQAQVDLPDRHHHGLINGIFQDSGDNSFRMHDNQLLRFNGKTLSWNPVARPAALPWSQLQSSGGHITAQTALSDSHFQLRDLSAEQKVLFESDKPIHSHHRDANGRIAALVLDEQQGHQVSLMTPNGDGSMSQRSFRFHLNAYVAKDPSQSIEPGRPAHVAVSGDNLYIADSHGELYSVSLSNEMNPNAKGSIPLRHHATELEEYGDEHPIKGFFTNSRGNLNAIVQGRSGQLHSCLEQGRGELSPSWNLSDTLSFSNKNGIRTEPGESASVHLDRFGSMKTQGGRLQYRDALTKTWQEMPGAHTIRNVSRGLDGNSYVVADGQVRRLAFTSASDKQVMGANIYNLGIQRNQPGISGQLLGGTAQDKYVSAAVIHSHHYIALDEQGQATVFNHSRAHHTPKHQPLQLTNTGLPEGETLSSIYFDRRKNLIGLTDKGTVMRMPVDVWSRADADKTSQWQPLAAPGSTNTAEAGQPAHISTQNQQQLTLNQNGQSWNLNTDGSWQEGNAASPPDVSASTPFDTKFQRLADAQKSKRIMGREVTLKAGALGFSNIEKKQNIQSGFRERLRAHYFRMDMQTPRPVKISAQAIQHQYKGRDGLADVYDSMHDLYTALHTRNSQHGAPRQPLDQRLHRLRNPNPAENLASLGEDGQRLLDDIKSFRDELDRSTYHALSLVAAKANLVDQHGVLKPKPKAKHQNTGVQAHDHDLTQELKAVWDRNGMQSTNSEAARFLKALDERGVRLTHTRDEVGSRRRDTKDEASMTKARLVLNTTVLDQLDTILTRLEDHSLGNEPINEASLTRIRQDFLNLRENDYRNHPVRAFSDMGHGNLKDLENNYDTAKGFIKAFTKDDHGVAMTSRSALDATDKAELKAAMTEVIQSLREGDSVSFGRAYEGGVNTLYNPVTQLAIFTSVMAGATSGVSRSLTFMRDEGDLYVTMGKNKAQGISLGGFFGQNVLPIMSGVEVNNPAFSTAFNTDVGGGQLAGFDLRAGFVASNVFGHTSRSGLEFGIAENDIESFVNGLVDGTATPEDLMQQGVDFANKHGRTLSYSFDMNGRFGVRAGSDTTPRTSNPFNRIRGEAGITLGANIAHYARTVDEDLAEGGKRDITGTKYGLFNSANASAGLWLQTYLSVNATEDGNHQLQDYGAFNGVEGRVTFEDSRTKQVDVQVKQPGPLPHDAVSKLITELESHFTDQETLRRLEEIRNLESQDFNERPDANELDLMKLARLETYFTSRLDPKLDQREAINDLIAMGNRAQAHKNQTCQLGEVKYSTTYTNLRKLNKESLTQVLLSHLSPGKATTAAKQLEEFATQDPKLNALIEGLRKTPNAIGKVTMELKPNIRLAAERYMANREFSGADVAKLVQDPNNLRIRDIKVMESGKLTETFTPLQVIAGGSSVSAVSMDKMVGQIYFNYPSDNSDSPRSFSILGEAAQGDDSTREAAASLAAQHGQELE
ncbi:AvrE-family type 3 secretion system effector [Pokkaliibacter sp. CJK22405]|uniref:AvrE-family type 3 secretion system effector n=1 Tax=Pokkaliibacter sp. CJK22405 TaxID=3384615 RepID=UPI0039853C49